MAALVNEVLQVDSLVVNLKHLTPFQRLNRSQFLAFSASCAIILKALYYAGICSYAANFILCLTSEI